MIKEIKEGDVLLMGIIDGVLQYITDPDNVPKGAILLPVGKFEADTKLEIYEAIAPIKVTTSGKKKDDISD